MIGKKIIRLKSVDSTNNEANKLGRAGAEEGAIVVAEAQTEGKGRRGHSWESPPAENLYFSVLLRPDLRPDDAQRLTVMAGVALAKFLSESVSMQVTLKWPNDIYSNGKKMGGILCESKIKKGILEFVVVGIGLNVNSTLESFSPALQKNVTSLFLEKGKEYKLDELLNDFFPFLEEEYKAFLRMPWEAYQNRFNEFV